ncbi:Plectin, partial [Ophiophagus hannah]
MLLSFLFSSFLLSCLGNSTGEQRSPAASSSGDGCRVRPEAEAIWGVGEERASWRQRQSQVEGRGWTFLGCNYLPELAWAWLPSHHTPATFQLGPLLNPSDSSLPPQAQRHVNDLYEDLRDGHNLISLLEVLSGDTLVRGLLRLLLGAWWAMPLFPPELRRKQLKLLHRGSQCRAAAHQRLPPLPPTCGLLGTSSPAARCLHPCVAWPELGVRAAASLLLDPCMAGRRLWGGSCSCPLLPGPLARGWVPWGLDL